jgi:hypothetical protein
MGTQVPHQDLEIVQGATFIQPFSWCSDVLVQKAITAITKGAVTVLTVPSHGMPSAMPCWLEEVGGMRQIRNNHLTDVPYVGTSLGANTVSVPITSDQYNDFTSGGALVYYQPQDLTGFTARMQIRESVGAAVALLDLTTSNSRISLDNTAKTITLTISATDTAAITWMRGVYDLELVSPGGIVYRVAQGAVFVNRETTRA